MEELIQELIDASYDCTDCNTLEVDYSLLALLYKEILKDKVK